MRATEFEFRHRFWIITGLFTLAFACYAFDHLNAGAALLQVLAGPGLNLLAPRGHHALQALFAVATAVAAAGAWIRTWGSAYLRSEVVHDEALRTQSLVADGPYRYVRNPLYIGGQLVFTAMGMMTSRTGWFLLAAGTFLFHYRMILREEAALLETQGDRYRAYCAAVPRLWPALRPQVPKGGMKPQWKQALAGESFMWAFVAATLCFAITLNYRLPAILIGLTLASYGLLIPLWIRRSNRRAATGS